MATSPQAALAAALDRMWAQHLPVLMERVDILDVAARAFATGVLSANQSEAAQAAAHKLAGVLGTFGLTRGTVLARELEIIYSRQNDADAELSAHVAATAAELRTVIASRPHAQAVRVVSR